MFGRTNWEGITGKNRNADYLYGLRQMTLADALAQGAGARASAMRMAGDDPSMAASYGLSSLLGGQSNASRMVGMGRLQWMKQHNDFLNQLRLLQKQQQMAKEAQGNPLMGALGSVGGMALGSWLAPGGWFAGKALGGLMGSPENINPQLAEYLRYM